MGARIVFNKALTVAQLPKLSHTYTARYSQGLAYTGLALTDPDQAATWLHAARETYQAAYEYCSGGGETCPILAGVIGQSSACLGMAITGNKIALLKTQGGLSFYALGNWL